MKQYKKIFSNFSKLIYQEKSGAGKKKRFTTLVKKGNSHAILRIVIRNYGINTENIFV